MRNLAHEFEFNIHTKMEKHNFVTIANLSTRKRFSTLIKMAKEFEKHPNREFLKGKSSSHTIL
jgi:aspartate carbamoyltransferase catalytic subunit